jgi:hypothetical protein
LREHPLKDPIFLQYPKQASKEELIERHNSKAKELNQSRSALRKE